MTRNRTAGKTATKKYTGMGGIAYAETTDTITINIRGRQLANLRRIAAAMNSVGWCDDDNGALTVLDGFVVGDILHNLGQPTGRYCGMCVGGVGEIAELIVSAIDTGFKDGTPEDKERKAALSAAFAKAGL